MSGSRFLERWSRLKKASEKAGAAAPEGELPDGEALLAALGPDSEFGVFLREEISEEVRRRAMKTLFADPRFNVMDGLDIYIDDYSVADPIPPEMLAMLNHARGLLFDEPPSAGTTDAGPVADCDNLTADGQNVPPVAAPRVGGPSDQ